MSDWIVGMKLVDGNGVIRSLPGDIGTLPVSPEEVMKAAKVNLGLFGVILEFTMKVQPMSNSQVKNIFSLKMEVYNNISQACSNPQCTCNMNRGTSLSMNKKEQARLESLSFTLYMLYA